MQVKHRDTEEITEKDKRQRIQHGDTEGTEKDGERQNIKDHMKNPRALRCRKKNKRFNSKARRLEQFLKE
jgi:hypothetical protein